SDAWTLGADGKISVNNAVDPVTNGVTLLLYYHRVVFQQTSQWGWYSWRTGQWMPEPGGDPRGCVPQCGGKQCGPDSCGGSCGSCGSDATCNASGSCDSAPPPSPPATCDVTIPVGSSIGDAIRAAPAGTSF